MSILLLSFLILKMVVGIILNVQIFVVVNTFSAFVGNGKCLNVGLLA